ncbi:MAG: hypothetical protein ABIF09_17180 [Gemmatimonadota bacterium]
MAPRASRFLFVLALMGPMTGCGLLQHWEPQILPEGRALPPPRAIPYLKAHLNSGELVVFSGWNVPAYGDSILEGYGVRYSVDRSPGNPDIHTLLLDSIALLEANRRETVGELAFAGLTTWTVISTYLTVVCVADPKECFGSCPTFYLEEGASERLVAEGFSSSVARVFEDNDVDALPDPHGGEGDYAVLMRNEAPETHAIRSLHLLAAPRSTGRSIYATTQGGFREGSPAREPTSCRLVGSGPEADCTTAVRSPDGLEFFSPADSLDLATREWMDLELPSVPDGRDVGILIRGRASLLSTFLFYQTIAYVGDEAGNWLASLERGDSTLAQRVRGLPDALGPVDVLVERDGEWVEVGSFGEAGPIAADEQVVTLPSLPSGPVRIRLRMAKGAWRLDRVGLVELGEEVEPLVLQPVAVETVSGMTPADLALDRLLDPDQHLVTQQGDEYRIHFQLPPGNPEWSLFLESRGYYYEWMREEWSRETDPTMAALILSNPEKALRLMAPAFKAREAGMEEIFWSSRFRRSNR